MKEVIIKNWKSWTIKAALNIVIASLMAGGYVKWQQVDDAASREDLRKNQKELLRGQKDFMSLNTIEHEKILFSANRYTDSQIDALEEKEKLKFDNIEVKLDIINTNLITLIKMGEKRMDMNEQRLERLEDVYINGN